MEKDLSEKINKFRKRGIWTSIITFLVIPILLFQVPKGIWRDLEPFAVALVIMLIITLLWTLLFRTLK